MINTQYILTRTHQILTKRILLILILGFNGIFNVTGIILGYVLMGQLPDSLLDSETKCNYSTWFIINLLYFHFVFITSFICLSAIAIAPTINHPLYKTFTSNILKITFSKIFFDCIYFILSSYNYYINQLCYDVFFMKIFTLVMNYATISLSGLILLSMVIVPAYLIINIQLGGKEKLYQEGFPINNTVQVINYEPIENDLDNLCSICLDEYNLNDNVAVFGGCNHRFHYVCLNEWFKTNRNCPTCRRKIDNTIA